MPGAFSLVQRIKANIKAGQTPRQAVVSAVKSVRSGGGGGRRQSGGGGGSSSTSPEIVQEPEPKPRQTTTENINVPPGNMPYLDLSKVKGVTIIEGDKTPTPKKQPPTYIPPITERGGTSIPEALGIKTRPKAGKDINIPSTTATSAKQITTSTIAKHAKDIGIEAGLQKYIITPAEQKKQYIADLNLYGQKYKDFDPSAPVTIEGVSHRGQDVYYNVPNFKGEYLHGNKSPDFEGKTKTLTASEYDIYTENLGSSMIGEASRVSETGQPSSELFSQASEYKKEWHPETKFFEYDPYYLRVDKETNKLVAGRTKGITEAGTTEVHVQFPYAGAEQYGSLSKELKTDPLKGALLGWGGQGLFNVDIAAYKMMGQEQKAMDVQVGRLSYYKNLEKLRQSDGLAFTGEAIKTWFSSPATQVGLSYVGGHLAGSYLTQKGLVTAATTGTVSKGGLLGKIVIGSIAVPLVGMKVHDISSEFAKGDIGKGIGKSFLFGTTIVAGLYGYGKGIDIGRIKADVKIQKYFDAHPEQIRFYPYIKGVRSGYNLEGKYTERVGLPVEERTASIILKETYKPKGELVMKSTPYKLGLQKFSLSGGATKPVVKMDTFGGTTLSKLQRGFIFFKKGVLDIKKGKTIVRTTRRDVSLFNLNEPLGGYTQTITIPPKSLTIPAPQNNIFFPAITTVSKSTSPLLSVGLSSGLETISKYAQPRFGELGLEKKPKFGTIQKLKPVFTQQQPVFSSAIVRPDFMPPMTEQVLQTEPLFEPPFVEPVMMQTQIFDKATYTPQVYKPFFPKTTFTDPPLFAQPLPSILPPLGFGKELYGGGGRGGGYSFFSKSKKFRKGELDIIFGIGV